MLHALIVHGLTRDVGACWSGTVGCQSSKDCVGGDVLCCIVVAAACDESVKGKERKAERGIAW